MNDDRAKGPQRTCGKCRACCTALIVDEIPKKEWERCKHLGPLGCKIYSKRPGACQQYVCAWLVGMGGKEERPDRLGVIFSLVGTEQLGDHAIVHEVVPGALQKPVVRRIISKLCERVLVFHIQRDSMRKLLGGPHAAVLPMMEKAREAGVLTVGGERVAPDVPLESLLRPRQPA